MSNLKFSFKTITRATKFNMFFTSNLTKKLEDTHFFLYTFNPPSWRVTLTKLSHQLTFSSFSYYIILYYIILYRERNPMKFYIFVYLSFNFCFFYIYVCVNHNFVNALMLKDMNASLHLCNMNSFSISSPQNNLKSTTFSLLFFSLKPL